VWSDVTSTIIESRAQRESARGARTLLRAAAVRDRAQRLLELALDERLQDWTVDLDRLAPAADFVAQVVRQRYPRLDVPLHSRWRHFMLNGRDLWADIVVRANWKSAEIAARAAFDLVITSVLLDAGAGASWHYHDAATGRTVARSEGLALASLRWFEGGGLSADAGDPCRVDAAVLRGIRGEALQGAFQAGDDNPLLGLPGRAALLNRFGALMESRPDLFAIADSPRPGGLFDALRTRACGARLPAATILETLLEALGPIWQDRPLLSGVPLGDCWPHPALTGEHPEDHYAPLHKLSQWLTYSLIEPLESAGIGVSNLHELTGLAEYRNGGLLVDMGVLNPRERARLSERYTVTDPFVVGWRALTVALLDRLAPQVAMRLGLAPELFALGRLLEGGTWAAGRLIARQRRVEGGPAFHVVSDGTVF
jgi:hypothetical protein